MDILKNCNYVSPQIQIVVFEDNDVIRLSGEENGTETGGAWNPDWDLFD